MKFDKNKICAFILTVEPPLTDTYKQMPNSGADNLSSHKQKPPVS